MTAYIYCRCSTDNGQTTDAQAIALSRRYPDAQVVTEVASGARNRPLLRALVAQLQTGDQLVVAALDRLGRRTSEILNLIEELERRKVVLVSVREGVDYSTPVGRLVTQILVSVAELERSLISERTKAGLAAAKAKGKLIGRPSALTSAQRENMARMVKSGMSIRKIAKVIGLSPAAIGRHVQKLQSQQGARA